MAKYDWDKIREEYIFGYITPEGQKVFPTQRNLAERHNIPISTIGTRASKEKWEEKKRAKSNKIEQKIIEKKTTYDAESIVISDDKFESAGELIRRVAVKQLEAQEERIKLGEYVRPIDSLNAANTVRIGQEIVKTAQGEVLNRNSIDQNTNMKVETSFDRVNKLLKFVNQGNEDGDHTISNTKPK